MEEGSISGPLPLNIFLRSKRAAASRCVAMIQAFAFSFSFFATLSLVLLTVLQLSLVFYWAKAYHGLTISVPKTFAWEIVIQALGSTFTDNLSTTSVSVPLDNANFDVNQAKRRSYTLPCIPVLALTSLSVAIFLSVLTFVEEYFVNILNASLKIFAVFTALNFIFCMGSVISLALTLSGDNGADARLKASMTLQTIKSFSPSRISDQWNNTQTAHRCCGIDMFNDWNHEIFRDEGNPRYPRSCCDSEKFSCKTYPTRSEVWQNGCFNKENGLITDWIMAAVYLLCTGLLGNVLTLILLGVARLIRGVDRRMSNIWFCRAQANPPLIDDNDTFINLDALAPTNPSILTPGNVQEIGSGDQLIQDQSDHIHNTGNRTCKISLAVDHHHENGKLYSLKRQNQTNILLNSSGFHVKSSTGSVMQFHRKIKQTAV